MPSTAWPLLTVLVSALEIPAVEGREERELELRGEVTHVRSDAGVVLGWSGRRVRWRAPATCAPAQVRLVAQLADGSEEALDVAVSAADGVAGLAVVRGDGEGVWEMQFPKAPAIVFSVAHGTIEPLASAGTCARALWRLSPPSRPDLSVVAAFAGGQLVDWAVLPREAPGVVDFETRPGGQVIVRVAGRRFTGQADASGAAKVRIEVGPGVLEARASGEDGEEFTVGLSPPPPQTEHAIRAPDGTRWLFRTDPTGRPSDGAPPDGWLRVSPGAYRIAAPPEARPPNERPVDRTRELDPMPGPSTDAPGSLQTARELDRTSVVPRASWQRVTVGATTGPSALPGVFVGYGRATPWRRAIDRGIGGALFLGRSRQEALQGGAGEADRRVVAIATWVEASLSVALIGTSWLEPALGLGLVGAWRSYVPRFQSGSSVVELGAATTLALRIGLGPVVAEARGVLSSASLGVESSPWLASAGVGWQWEP